MTDSIPPRSLGAANLVRHSLAEFARRMRGLRANHGVSASKLIILGRLYRAARAMSATELAELEGLQPQSLTRIIADLEANGFIERSQNAGDRRQFDIAISQAGIDLLVQDARSQNAWLASAVEQRLTRAERAILLLAAELLDRLGGDDTGASTSEPVTEQGESADASKSRSFKRKRMDDAVFENCSLQRAHFSDINLLAGVFENVNLRGARFENVNLAGVTIDDANIDGLTILGHDVTRLIRQSKQ